MGQVIYVHEVESYKVYEYESGVSISRVIYKLWAFKSEKWHSITNSDNIFTPMIYDDIYYDKNARQC